MCIIVLLGLPLGLISIVASIIYTISLLEGFDVYVSNMCTMNSSHDSTILLITEQKLLSLTKALHFYQT